MIAENPLTIDRAQIVTQLRARYQANDTAEVELERDYNAKHDHIHAEWNSIDAELERHGIGLWEIEA
jgi:hypothetical protein